jgi:hypothetical protein
MSRSTRTLQLYACFSTAVLAGTLLMGNASQRAGTTKFGEITVERINLVEPDGKLRLVLSNEARLPGIIKRGQERRHAERKAAGLLFYNNEVTEAGGLIFGGSRDASGRVSQGLNFTFDQYEQDQTLQLTHQQNGSDKVSGMVLSDRPDGSIPYEIIDMPRGPRAGPADGGSGAQRLIWPAARGHRQEQ